MESNQVMGEIIGEGGEKWDGGEGEGNSVECKGTEEEG